MREEDGEGRRGQVEIVNAVKQLEVSRKGDKEKG